MDTDQVIYGAGSLWGVDANGVPVKFGTLQDVTVDFSRSLSYLRGKNEYPVKQKTKESKIAFKAKVGMINGAMLNALYFNGTLSTGRERLVDGEAATIPSATAYTVVVANGANFLADMGISYADGSGRLEQVSAGNEAAGAYSVDASTGTYTFDATDAGKNILIDYTWTDTTGHTIAVDNKTTGVVPVFTCYLRDTNDEGEFGMKVFSCTSSKLAIATKMGDFAIPEFDFEAADNGGGHVFEMYTE